MLNFFNKKINLPKKTKSNVLDLFNKKSKITLNLKSKFDFFHFSENSKKKLNKQNEIKHFPPAIKE